MKIVFANSYYAPNIGGGAEIILKNLAEGMLARGHEVSVLSTGQQDTRDEVDGVAVRRLRSRNIYWGFPDVRHSALAKLAWHGLDRHNGLQTGPIRQALQEAKPDVLATHNISGLSVAVWQEAQALGIPIVHMLHDYYLLCPSVTMYKGGQNCSTPCGRCRVFRGPHAQASRAVHTVVGASEAILNRHLQFGLFADSPVKRVIYNAQNLPPPAPRADPGSAPMRKFGFIGALSDVKGVRQLIEAFKQASAVQTGLSLTIAGTGEPGFVAELKSAASSPGISFIGHTQAMAFFSQIDVCVVPSRWHDPFPGVVYEAISQGVPVIGARRGGIAEVVKDGLNGRLFEPQTQGELCHMLLAAARDSRTLMADRSACIASVQALTVRDRMLDEHEAALTLASHHGR
jgi:glycosyltransferase involved in cell wall biosynthesis